MFVFVIQLSKRCISATKCLGEETDKKIVSILFMLVQFHQHGERRKLLKARSFYTLRHLANFAKIVLLFLIYAMLLVLVFVKFLVFLQNVLFTKVFE